ncbi:MAG: extracellular solute-binding protein [Armatimonadetes bacterium]|nr:extracellular solute-binding protein [Armatimonadota bacterium]
MGARKRILAFLGVVLASLGPSSFAQSDGDIVIRMLPGGGYGIPPKESTSITAQVRRSVFEAFHRSHPGVRVVNAGGLSFSGSNLDDSMFLMSMAGDSSPDIFYVNFRQYYTFLEQGFCRSLDDLIAKDPDVMARCNPTVKKVLTSYDGKVYAVPFFQVATALYYRRDFFRSAGLDPDKPPKTWDELVADAQKMTDPKVGRYGFALSSPPGYQWSNFLYAAGGESVRQDANGDWKSAINTPAAGKAVEFFRRLMVGENPPGTVSKDLNDDIRRGKAAMWLNYTNDVLLQQSELPPSVIGIARVPAGPAGYSNEVNAGMWAISSRVTDPAKLKACWDFIKFFAGDEAAKINTDKCIELGMGNLVNPSWLKKFGYTDLLAQVDPAYAEANDELFQTGHPEPYGKNCQQVYSVLDNALDRARLNPKEPVERILAAAESEMNDKLLGYTPPEIMARQRGWAIGILSVICIALVSLAIYFVRRARANPVHFVERIPPGTDRRKMRRFMTVCLAPAVITIAVWSYYPLARGLEIAFQDYGIQRPPRWVGLDNFIGVFTQPLFYKSLWNSVVYVSLTLLIGFFMPIFLALALNEIPRFKVLFRTIFYLPAMTSSIVIAFVWRQFYDKSPSGLLNSIVGPVIEHVVNPLFHLVGHAPWPTANDWLGDPSLAMFAVVLPGIWAGAGPGSILYLAALKNIATERYEAADLDGANWRQKIRYITLPGLKPLILINLLGVFIAGFKAMENVFVLTMGGPLNSTRTIGLEVWQNAFMYLKFGYATAAAWVMGSILIGFTLVQIRSLLKMRFSTARS